MSRLQLAIAALTTAAIAALLGWQFQRDAGVKACHDSGGIWYGPSSACKHPVRPILRRELERS